MPKLPLYTAPEAHAGAEFVWFAYGSSLDFDAFSAWGGEHGYRLPDSARVQPAVLRGWRLSWCVPSKFWGGVVASVVEGGAADQVEGIAWPMPASALGLVRHKEGVVSGLFEERGARCAVGSGEIDCQLYVAATGRRVPEGSAPPAQQFARTLVKGAKARGLSAAWIAELEAVAG